MSTKLLQKIIGIISTVLILQGCGPNMQFLRFDNAVGGDNGTLSFLPDSNRQILLFPISIRTAYDNGRIERDMYPATQLSIHHYFDSLLSISGNQVTDILKADSNDVRKTATMRFASNVIRKAAIGTGDPLGWGITIQEGTISSQSIIFLPVAIERESQHAVTGRLYFVIANSVGKVIFCRSIDFDPIQWSSDFAVFEKDIMGRIPLTSQ